LSPGALYISSNELNCNDPLESFALKAAVKSVFLPLVEKNQTIHRHQLTIHHVTKKAWRVGANSKDNQARLSIILRKL